jgi:hypothetical protein
MDPLGGVRSITQGRTTSAQWPYKMAGPVPSAAPATRESVMQLMAKGRENSCTPCTIFKFITSLESEEGGHCKTRIFHCENFLASFSTCAQSVPPRIQSRVPLPLPPSCASGTTHLMSCTFGHGQSMGLLTHTSVSWQRYSEQETVINKNKE